ATIHKLTVEGDYSVEEVDALTGPLIGLPKSATYRLMDIVGLDVWAYVTRNLHEIAPGDPWRERFVVPEFFEKVIERGWLGEKRGQGFYKRVGKGEEKEIWALDWKSLEYHPVQKVRLASVEAAKNIEDLRQRLRTLLAADDRAGSFLWKLFSDVFLYSAAMVPEISDRIVEIDRAMRWGYAHTLGPFELWDALGVPQTVDRLRQEQRPVPESVERMLAGGAQSFYRPADRDGCPHTEYFDLPGSKFRELELRAGVLTLAEVKRARGVVKQNAGASLIDVGDGVLCVEFHSKMNAIGEDLIAMVRTGLDECARNFEA